MLPFIGEGQQKYGKEKSTKKPKQTTTKKARNFLRKPKRGKEKKKSFFSCQTIVINMVTKYHKKIEDALLKLGEDLISQKRVRKIYRGNVAPLSLVDPRTKSV